MKLTFLRPKVYEILWKIPKGKVTTYKCIAKMLNTSPRVIAKILATNTSNAPCYKVVRTNGYLSGYRGKKDEKHLQEKARLLRNEGIEVIDFKVDLKKYFYCPLNSEKEEKE